MSASDLARRVNFTIETMAELARGVATRVEMRIVYPVRRGNFVDS